MARRTILIALALLVCSAVVLGDEVLLHDGRRYVGIVTVAGDEVVVRMDYATISLPRSQVARIDFKQTLDQQFTARLEKIALDDANGLFDLGQWASQQNLPRHAAQAYELAIKADPDHADARRSLGHVKIDGKWQDFAQALELVRGKFAAGATDDLLGGALAAMEQAAPSADRLLAVRELKGLAQLKGKLFPQARGTFDELAAKAQGADAFRYSAIAEILKDNSDGMYLVREPYPPGSLIATSQPAQLKPGPASLADPAVLSAAILERAKKEIESGRALLAEAGRLEATDPDAALGKFAQASRAFDRADALVTGLSGSYRIEIIRRRIAGTRRLIDADARRYDEEVKNLGKVDLSPQEYRNMVVRWIHLLDNIRNNLKSVLAMAAPYSRELVLEIQWAQTDLKRIERSREILTAELEEADPAFRPPR